MTTTLIEMNAAFEQKIDSVKGNVSETVNETKAHVNDTITDVSLTVAEKVDQLAVTVQAINETVQEVQVAVDEFQEIESYQEKAVYVSNHTNMTNETAQMLE